MDNKDAGLGHTSGKRISMELTADSAQVTSLNLKGSRLVVTIEAELTESQLQGTGLLGVPIGGTAPVQKQDAELPSSGLAVPVLAPDFAPPPTPAEFISAVAGGPEPMRPSEPLPARASTGESSRLRKDMESKTISFGDPMDNMGFSPMPSFADAAVPSAPPPGEAIKFDPIGLQSPAPAPLSPPIPNGQEISPDAPAIAPFAPSGHSVPSAATPTPLRVDDINMDAPMFAGTQEMRNPLVESWNSPGMEPLRPGDGEGLAMGEERHEEPPSAISFGIDNSGISSALPLAPPPAPPPTTGLSFGAPPPSMPPIAAEPPPMQSAPSFAKEPPIPASSAPLSLNPPSFAAPEPNFSSFDAPTVPAPMTLESPLASRAAPKPAPVAPPSPEPKIAPEEQPKAPDEKKQTPEAGGTTVLIRYTCPKCKTQGMQAVDKVGTVVNCSNCGKAMRLVMKK